MTLADLRRALDAAVAEVPANQLAELVGLLAATDARVRARMVAPARERTAPAGELVTAEIVAERFHLAVSSVHELARMGRIPCRMFGRFRRFDLAEVAAAGLDSKTHCLAADTRGEKAA